MVSLRKFCNQVHCHTYYYHFMTELMLKMAVLVFKLLLLIYHCSNADLNNDSMDNETGNTKYLYFAYIATITGSFSTSGGIPIVDMVLDQVNNSSDILENYTLSYTDILDSKVTLCCILDYILIDFSAIVLLLLMLSLNLSTVKQYLYH